MDLIVNLKAWQSLPRDYQAILEAAAAVANIDMLAKYDAFNMPALKRLVAAGTQLRVFPNALMQAAYVAANNLYAEHAEKNENFRKIFASWQKFRNEQIHWFAVDENRYDSFMYSVVRNAPAAK